MSDLPPSPSSEPQSADASAPGAPVAAQESAGGAAASAKATATPAAPAVGSAGAGDANWERGLVERLALASLREQRYARRWSIFFKSLAFAYVAVAMLYFLDLGWGGSDTQALGRHTALVKLDGQIDSEGLASAEKINNALNNAFRDKNTAGVILRINSPGGSPVQAGMINDEIRRLRREFPQTPLYVVVEEMCASAAYYIAAASDQVFVDKASIVGSIGVIMDSFGFTGVMDKVGVERRVQTAGRNKAIGDPFLPVTAEQKEHIQLMLDEIHQQFIKVVREGRGKRLRETNDMFTGLFWSGVKSVDLGLADGLGTVDSVARDVVKAEVVVDYTEKENVAERLAKRLGASLGTGAMQALTRVWRLN